MKKNSKALKITAITLSSVFALMCILFIYAVFCLDNKRGFISYDKLPQTQNMEFELTYEQACADFDYFCQSVRDRHPAWLDGSKELVEAFEKQCSAEKADFDTSITVEELYIAARRTAAVLHDGHTSVYAKNNQNTLYINDFSQLINIGKPVSIDGIPCEKLLEAYKVYTPYELDCYIESVFYNSAIINDTDLRYCGVDTSDGVVMKYSDGSEYSYSFVTADKITGRNNSSSPDRGWVYYDIDKERNLGIFTLGNCTNNEEYQKTVKSFFEEVSSQGITNIAVDLRGNGGGDSSVANEFLRYIDIDKYNSWDNSIRFGPFLLENKGIIITNDKIQPVFSGRIFVLTDVYTFSSAMDFAMLIGDNDIGEIIGKTSGNNPSGYGDYVQLCMENSGLFFTVSTKKWYRVDLSKNEEPLTPHYEVTDQTALEKVYELI